MFFTTYQFVFFFLPLVLAGHYLIRRSAYPQWSVYWLLVMSAVFYWSLDRTHLLTVVTSIVINYLMALRLERLKSIGSPAVTSWFWTCLGFNAAFLASFKYGFAALGVDMPVPLGLSFFTLVQIGYHIAIHTDRTAQRFKPSNFALFVGYFPSLVAGPVMTKKDFSFDALTGRASFDSTLFMSGLALFTMGLFKKVVLADSVATEVSSLFSAVGIGTTLTTPEAWLAAVMYTLQLYFDFSGYTDMACGVSAMLGMRLLRNFYSPLKATSIMEYWRRWHMSVTKFFTNNLYLLVTVNLTRTANKRKVGPAARFVLTVFGPMLICFTLIGVWHGSGANFLWFGLLMATALSVNHLWIKRAHPSPLPKPVAWAVTMAVVVCGMILDKTGSFGEAAGLFQSMVGAQGTGTQVLQETSGIWKVAVLGGVALLLPNTHQILSAYQPVLPEAWDDAEGAPKRLTWRISTAGMATMSFVLVCGLIAIPRASEFIYYRF